MATVVAFQGFDEARLVAVVIAGNGRIMAMVAAGFGVVARGIRGNGASPWLKAARHVEGFDSFKASHYGLANAIVDSIRVVETNDAADGAAHGVKDLGGEHVRVIQHVSLSHIWTIVTIEFDQISNLFYCRW